MNQMELTYRKAIEAARKLPPEEAAKLIAAVGMVCSAWGASSVASQVMIEASATPVEVPV